MKKFIRIKHRLAVRTVAGFLIILCILAGIGVFTLMKLKSIREDLVELARIDVPLMEAVTNIAANQLGQHRVIEQRLRYGLLYTDNPTRGLDEMKNQFDEYLLLANAGFTQAERLILQGERPIHREIDELLVELRKECAAFDVMAKEIFDRLYEGQVLDANTIMTGIEADTREIDQRVKGIMVLLENNTEDQVESAQARELAALIAACLLTVVAMILGFVFSVLLWKELCMLEDHFRESTETPEATD